MERSRLLSGVKARVASTLARHRRSLEDAELGTRTRNSPPIKRIVTPDPVVSSGKGFHLASASALARALAGDRPRRHPRGGPQRHDDRLAQHSSHKKLGRARDSRIDGGLYTLKI